MMTTVLEYEDLVDFMHKKINLNKNLYTSVSHLIKNKSYPQNMSKKILFAQLSLKASFKIEKIERTIFVIFSTKYNAKNI